MTSVRSRHEAAAGVTIRFNNSGEARNVLKHALVELTAGFDEAFPGLEGEIELRARFATPSGVRKERPALQVERPGFAKCFVVRFAPAEAGRWRYRLEAHRGGREAAVLEIGRFEVYALEGRIPPPAEREVPPYRVLYNQDPILTKKPYYVPGRFRRTCGVMRPTVLLFTYCGGSFPTNPYRFNPPCSSIGSLFRNRPCPGL